MCRELLAVNPSPSFQMDFPHVILGDVMLRGPGGNLERNTAWYRFMDWNEVRDARFLYALLKDLPETSLIAYVVNRNDNIHFLANLNAKLYEIVGHGGDYFLCFHLPDDTPAKCTHVMSYEV